MEQDHAIPPLGLGRVFRSLRYRNFRLFFSGQIVSLMGTWIQRTALFWLVYRQTSSPKLVGLTGFCQFVPIFVISPFAGLLADRMDRRRLVMACQVLGLVQALALGALALADRAGLEAVLVLSLALGVINAFDVPARQSLFVSLIDERQDLNNAIALNSAMFNAARLVGPAVSGFLISAVGEGWCFVLNAASFVPVIWGLWAMRLPERAPGSGGQGKMEGLKAGFLHAFRSPVIRPMILFLALVSLAGPYAVLLPMMARDVLGGGPNTYGFLLAAAGGGALCGAFYMAWRRGVAGLGRVIVVASFCFGLGLLLLSVSRTLWMALAVLGLVGFGLMVQVAASNTFIQSVVDDAMRGRVMSLYALSLLGMVPFGNLIGGYLGEHVGLTPTLVGGGTVCLAAATLFSRSQAGWRHGQS